MSNSQTGSGAIGALFASATQSRSTADAMPLSRQHVRALDGIRGLAILLVMAYHFGRSASVLFDTTNPILAVTAAGWSGVDLFFVLSGFLITGILFDSRSGHNFFVNFYARRTLRIFPLYYGALALVVALYVLSGKETGAAGANQLWIVFYLTNFLMVSDGASATGILSHYWSLAIEEHFYLVWPALVYLCSRRQMMAICGGLIVTAFALRVALVLLHADPLTVYVLTPARMDALAVGALCSLAIRGPAGLAGLIAVARWATLLAGAGLLATMLLRGTMDELDPVIQTVGYSLAAIAFGGTILLSTGSRRLGRALSGGALRWFGRYSYSLYVWHPIINVILLHSAVSVAMLQSPFVTDHIGHDAAVALLLLAATALDLAVAYLSFHVWESRFLALKRFF